MIGNKGCKIWPRPIQQLAYLASACFDFRQEQPLDLIGLVCLDLNRPRSTPIRRPHTRPHFEEDQELEATSRRPLSQQRPMRMKLSWCLWCLGLIDNGQHKSTIRLMVLVAHERSHGIMRILEILCMLLPNSKALKVRAIKGTLEFACVHHPNSSKKLARPSRWSIHCSVAG